MNTYKQHFSHFLAKRSNSRLHFAAHSHHLWPDVTRAAHTQTWNDAAQKIDNKWETILSHVIPEAQRHIAARLSLPDPQTIAFAPNTHEFVLRLHSGLAQPSRILTTDAEFHSFHRQRRRWQEAGCSTVDVVTAEPLADFGSRFLAAAQAKTHSMIYLSQVFFNSGYVVDIINDLVDLIKNRDTVVVIDGYHAFMALPIDLSAVADRIFFIAGGYKYAMAGEGVCFMHCPPGVLPRPVNTGWYAGFEELSANATQVRYPLNGTRFAGATFDPSGLYRFNAVQRLLEELGVTVEDIHKRVLQLHKQFIAECKTHGINLGELIPGESTTDRGHFLTFRTNHADERTQLLAKNDILVDSRHDRLRFGFGIYHDPDDVSALVNRLATLPI